MTVVWHRVCHSIPVSVGSVPTALLVSKAAGPMFHTGTIAQVRHPKVPITLPGDGALCVSVPGTHCHSAHSALQLEMRKPCMLGLLIVGAISTSTSRLLSNPHRIMHKMEWLKHQFTLLHTSGYISFIVCTSMKMCREKAMSSGL